jgi:hypothetical protein
MILSKPFKSTQFVYSDTEYIPVKSEKSKKINTNINTNINININTNININAKNNNNIVKTKTFSNDLFYNAKLLLK